MKWTGLNELRESFLAFFESKGHLRLPSFSLVPQGDNSLLLINSGMAPMKKYFTGEVAPPRKRVATCQKCIRTPDIERVGIFARYGTYFEMLGNFSFGDYFKKEACGWAWEYFTKVLEIPENLLYASIYEKDDEAFDIWANEVGIDPSHIVRLGKEDNFWEHGTGPCGPCSEIYFDRGEKHGCGSPDCAVGCDCDRFMEVWNNVFTQFDSDGKGNYTPLANPNIDTGMGLERLAIVVQGADNLFLVDTIQSIMKHVSEIAGVPYGQSDKTDISLRVITDHIRSTTFMISDGVTPSNSGRGYVLRRLLRRAARHGRLLGITKPFLSEVCDTVIKNNEQAYPMLAEKRDFIRKVISIEEDNFARTIDAGMQILEGFITEHGREILSGIIAFKLQDTYGFPIDLTIEILADRGMKVDVEGFKKIYNDYRAKTRKDSMKEGSSWESGDDPLAGVDATEFVGYDNDAAEARVLAIISGGRRVPDASEGDEVAVVLNATPFYAESGGQAGDTGNLFTDTLRISVTDTIRGTGGQFVHKGVIESGEVKEGDIITAAVDAEKRSSTRRNHTAAHLLQAALRRVLGGHVEQAGQLVNDQAMRFDFSHFAALTGEELRAAEDMVNREILRGQPVETLMLPIDEAKKMGAMALFGEKYGDVVRVVKSGDFSAELCGGTHVDNTSKLGLFKIMSEASVAAGVRRVEGITGTNVLDIIHNQENLLHTMAASLKVQNPAELPVRIAKLQSELKETERQLEQIKSEQASGAVRDMLDSSVDINGIKLIVRKLGDASPDDLRAMGDKVRDFTPDAVAVFAGVNGDKATIFVSCGAGAVKSGAHAGNIVRAIAQLAGGNGGGKPDSAMAGAKDISKLDDALAAAEGIVRDVVKS
ncbi:MAG: alanine--tRNA ligase [Oscillospiraceae bacterium]|nr:alanine--tRNA ligase [Oscillospiraceae bacterium]